MSNRYRSRRENPNARITRRHFLGGAGLMAGAAGCLAPAKGYGFSAERPLVTLPPPRRSGGRPLLETLNDRATRREFSRRPVSEQVLSDLLWAAFGVNRPDTGQRTAPSAMDHREIDLVVVMERGTFVLEPVEHRLRQIAEADLRPLTGGQDYVRVAPVSLVYVADHRRQGKISAEERRFYAAADAGFIGQNVYLFCASEGLASVVHVVSQPVRLADQLGCVPEQEVVLAQCVGFPAG